MKTLAICSISRLKWKIRFAKNKYLMIWKSAREFPNYEVYEDGTIWRMEHRTPRGTYLKRKMIKPYRAKNNYMVVSLHDSEGKRRQIYVHRLVYMAFFGDIKPNEELDHIDLNRANNSVSNLRLCSHRTNCNNPKSIERYRAANALEKGKFNREKMQEARGEKREQELKDLYLFIFNEKGKVKLWKFINRGHCNYYRGARIVSEMSKAVENMGVSN